MGPRAGPGKPHANGLGKGGEGFCYSPRSGRKIVAHGASRGRIAPPPRQAPAGAKEITPNVMLIAGNAILFEIGCEFLPQGSREDHCAAGMRGLRPLVLRIALVNRLGNGRGVLFRPSGAQEEFLLDSFTHGWRHGLRSFTRVQNRARRVGDEVQDKRSLCGEAGGLSHAGGRANLSPAEIEERQVPRPLGGEGGLQPAFSSAGAGRVRGSKTLGPTEIMPEVFVLTFAFCILRFDLFSRLRHDACVLVKTPSPPALRSPPLPQGGEGE